MLLMMLINEGQVDSDGFQVVRQIRQRRGSINNSITLVGQDDLEDIV